MAIFNSYVCLPEGTSIFVCWTFHSCQNVFPSFSRVISYTWSTSLMGLLPGHCKMLQVSFIFQFPLFKVDIHWLSYLHWGLHILNPIRFCWFLPWYPWKSRVSICLLCNVLSIQAVLNTKQFSSLATCSFGSSYNTPKEKRRLKAIRDGKEVGLGMAKLTFGRCFFYR